MGKIIKWFINTNKRGNERIGKHYENDAEIMYIAKASCFNLRGKVEKLNLWQVDYAMVADWVENKKKDRLTFRVFKQMESEEIREVELRLCKTPTEPREEVPPKKEHIGYPVFTDPPPFD